MKINKKSHSVYSRLKRKMFVKTLFIAFISIVSVLAFRFINAGQLGGHVVTGIADFFYIETASATNIYLRLRNYLEILIVLLMVAIFLIFFRLLINSFAKYFDEIVQGIDQIISGVDDDVKLSSELEFVEHKLNKLKQTLENKEHKAQRSEQRKNDLVIYSAHDIKTPLTSIIGYVILLDDNPDIPSEKRIEYIKVILDKARRLDSMTSEFFEIIRYNLHDIKLNKVQIDLFNMLIQMKEEFYPLLEAGNKQVKIQADEDIIILGDPERLARVFNNILKNAIAYSQADSVINITAAELDKHIVIEFSNYGAVIPEEQLDCIFEQFYRLDSARENRAEGAGLGLAIAKEIITLHGGTIMAGSSSGQTTFTVTLPKKES